MFYIDDATYNRKHDNLLSQDESLVKFTLQELISAFEQHKLLSPHSKAELCLAIQFLLRRNSAHLRKWVYHLSYYCSNAQVLQCLLDRIQYGKETDIENITWILAILSKAKYNTEELYNKHLRNKISSEQYKACTVVFSQSNSLDFGKEDIKKILSSEDPLSKIWLTKAFVCPYKPISCVTVDTMNQILRDPIVSRYALWAFSTKNNFSISKIDVRPEDAKNLPDKDLGWFYTCLFKDYEYIQKSQDHVKDIFEHFFQYPNIVQLGIIKGILLADYPAINDFLILNLLQIFSTVYENLAKDTQSLYNILIQIFIKYCQQSSDFNKLLLDLKRSSKHVYTRNLLQNFQGEARMKNNYFYGNTLYVEKADEVKQININDSDKEYLLTMVKKCHTDVDSGKFDDILETPKEIAPLIEQLQLSIEEMPTSEKSNKHFKKFIESFEEFKKTKKKSTFLNLLDVLSNICTIATSVPAIYLFAKNAIQCIMAFFNIG